MFLWENFPAAAILYDPGLEVRALVGPTKELTECVTNVLEALHLLPGSLEAVDVNDVGMLSLGSVHDFSYS